MKLYFFLIYHWQEQNSTQSWCGNRKSLGSSFHFHPRNVKRVITVLIDRSCLEFLAGARIEFRYAGCVNERA